MEKELSGFPTEEYARRLFRRIFLIIIFIFLSSVLGVEILWLNQMVNVLDFYSAFIQSAVQFASPLRLVFASSGAPTITHHPQPLLIANPHYLLSHSCLIRNYSEELKENEGRE